MTEPMTQDTSLATRQDTWLSRAASVETTASLNPTTLEGVTQLAQMMQKSPLLPKALRGDVGGTILVLAQTVQMGLPWTVGLKELYVVGNKVHPQARLLRALVERDPNCLQFYVESASNESATTVVQRRGMKEPVRVTYTLKDAEKAGLTKQNPNYQTRPREMLIARSSTLAANTYFPGVCLGLDLEELDPTLEAPADTATVRRRRQPKPDPMADFEPEEPTPREPDAEAQSFVDALDVEEIPEEPEEAPPPAKPKAKEPAPPPVQPGALLLDLRPPTPPPAEVDLDDAEFVVQYAQKHFGAEEAEKILRGELADCGVSTYSTPAQGLTMLTMDGYTRILTSLRARVRAIDAETDRPSRGRKV